MKLAPWAKFVLVAGVFLSGFCLGYRALPYRIRQSMTMDGDEPWDEMRFDQTKWIAKTSWADNWYPGGGRPLRALMAQDTVMNHVNHGMRPREVLALLGKPDSDSGTKPDCWYYELGSWSRWGMDGADYLAVGFSKEGFAEVCERMQW